jgi:hypothetical protein
MERRQIILKNSDSHLLLQGFLSGAEFGAKPLYQGGKERKDRLTNCVEMTLNNEISLNLFDLNLFNIRKLYYQTQEFCNQEATLDNLQRKLELELPQVILCHSMGCQLLENYIQSGRKLPDETRRIIYCQPDTRSTSSDLIEILCSPVDLILWLSALVNLSLPTGLHPIKGTQHMNSNPEPFQTLQSHPFWPVGSHLAPLDFGITVE